MVGAQVGQHAGDLEADLAQHARFDRAEAEHPDGDVGLRAQDDDFQRLTRAYAQAAPTRTRIAAKRPSVRRDGRGIASDPLRGKTYEKCHI